MSSTPWWPALGGRCSSGGPAVIGGQPNRRVRHADLDIRSARPVRVEPRAQRHPLDPPTANRWPFWMRDSAEVGRGCSQPDALLEHQLWCGCLLPGAGHDQLHSVPQAGASGSCPAAVPDHFEPLRDDITGLAGVLGRGARSLAARFRAASHPDCDEEADDERGAVGEARFGISAARVGPDGLCQRR